MPKRKTPPPLPSLAADRNDVAAAFERLIAAGYTATQINDFIALLQTNDASAQARVWLGRQAALEIAEVMETARTDYGTARQIVGKRWGYVGNTNLGNFNKRLADPGWFDVFSKEPDRPRAGRR